MVDPELCLKNQEGGYPRISPAIYDLPTGSSTQVLSMWLTFRLEPRDCHRFAIGPAIYLNQISTLGREFLRGTEESVDPVTFSTIH